MGETLGMSPARPPPPPRQEGSWKAGDGGEGPHVSSEPNRPLKKGSSKETAKRKPTCRFTP